MLARENFDGLHVRHIDIGHEWALMAYLFTPLRESCSPRPF